MRLAFCRTTVSCVFPKTSARDARFHVLKTLLRLFIPCSSIYIFGRLRLTKVVGQFLLHFLTEIDRSAKLPYSELLINFAYVKAVMWESVAYFLHNRYLYALVVVS